MDFLVLLFFCFVGYCIGKFLKLLISKPKEKNTPTVIKNYHYTTKVENHLHVSDAQLKRLITDK